MHNIHLYLSGKVGNIPHELFLHAWAKFSYWDNNATVQRLPQNSLPNWIRKKNASEVQATQIQA